MKERPILFNGAMVRAVLAGTKTQTRRIAKGVHIVHEHTGEALAQLDSAGPRISCPYGQPGDRLWVRETWNTFDGWDGYYYAADDHSWGIGEGDDPDHVPEHAILWRPSIHMPRAASRITLEITSVRVERLQDISEADAKAEGIYKTAHGFWSTYGQLSVDGTYSPSVSFHALWQSVNGAEGPTSWTANPWVWVVEFKRLEAST